eukprot:421944-Alexandrium_andersonii.AAC.1
MTAQSGPAPDGRTGRAGQRSRFAALEALESATDDVILRLWHQLSVFLDRQPTSSQAMAPIREGWDVVVAAWLLEEVWLADLPGDASDT